MSEMNDNEIQKRDYEISFLLLQENALAIIEQVIAAHGGEIFYKQPVSQIRLMYPINKQQSAYFGFAHFHGKPETVANIKHDLGLKPEVLRLLIITPPTPLKQERKPRAPEKPVLEAPSAPLLSNEALEQKLEEILK